jgi:FkbM family methyltransferase
MSEARTLGRSSRFHNFLLKPTRKKIKAALYWWVRAFPRIPLPMPLPFGGWWLVRNDFVGAALLHEGFEDDERIFVQRFVRDGMKVLDIGAHHGFYTLLASRAVGSQGKVLAVEASPREKKKLELNIRINRCENVQIESRAIGEKHGSGELYLVLGGQTGCNSLRKPAVSEPTQITSVSIEQLDRVLEERQFGSVDFVKLDVEGGELGVLRGGQELLRRQPRPVFLIEVQDVRTENWGYPARDIIQFLLAVNFRWFRLLTGGGLEPLEPNEGKYNGNFVAVPLERLGSMDDLIQDNWSES